MTNSILELEDSDVIMIFGSNTTETHPIIASSVRRAVQKGSKLIVVDPRMIDMVYTSSSWLPTRVGTDVALVNAMMHVIIKEGLENKQFIQEHTEGYEELKQHVQKYTPEYSEKITGVKAEDIEIAARLYAKAENGSICYTMGITQHTSGVNNVRSLANLVMLCGHIGRPSTGLNPLRGQNNVQGACDMGALPNVYTAYQKVDDPAAQEKFEKAWGVGLPSKPGTVITHAFDKFGKDIKAFLCFGENPALSEPDLPHARQALEKPEFMVVMDLFLTETAFYADVVLPCSTFAEIDGTYTNSERSVRRVRKAIDAPGKSMPGWWIMNELGKRMGYDMGLENAKQIWDEQISELSPSMKGIKYDLLEKQNPQWPKPTLEHPGTQYLHKGGNFAKGKGSFAVIEHSEPAEIPDAEYPLWLTTGRRLHQFHTGTMTRRAVGLDDILGEENIQIHPLDAKRFGIEDGRKLKAKSRRGEVEVRAKVTARVPQGTVFMAFHFWEANANELTNAALDPIAKIPEFKACAVSVEPL